MEATQTLTFRISKIKIKGVLLILVILGAALTTLSIAKGVEATSLFISPASRSLAVSETFSIEIFVSSPSQAINAAEATISFPPDKLQVISLSKNGSILNLWMREPSFSNSLGTISFAGIIFNPGFTGAAGKIITVKFKALTPGSAPVAFSDGSVLANDGRGSNILSGFRDANFFASTASPGPSPGPSPPTEAPTAPLVSSPPPSPEPITIQIKSGTITQALQLISLAVLLVLLLIFWYLWKRFVIIGKELKELTTGETEHHRRLESLRRDIKKQITTLEDVARERELTAEEKEILEELKQELVKTASI